ncbi:transposase [Metarhizobium album]|uniref:transposase n=1 Tax=Metarhizobium album TaxID=2182425 RepID=UPI001FDF9F0D|nr:transposase [Rhizobium album]
MSDKVNQGRTFEVLTATPSRRSPRHWSDDEKARLVAEAFSPGGTVAEVARAYELACRNFMRGAGRRFPRGRWRH